MHLSINVRRTWVSHNFHYNDVIMGAIASQITSLSIVYSTIYSSADQRKLRATGFCEGNSPVTGVFPAQMASNVENVSILWRHHDKPYCASRKLCCTCALSYDSMWAYDIHAASSFVWQTEYRFVYYTKVYEYLKCVFFSARFMWCPFSLPHEM